MTIPIDYNETYFQELIQILSAGSLGIGRIFTITTFQYNFN